MSLSIYAIDSRIRWEILACLLLLCWLIRTRSIRKGKGHALRLPPGPPGKFIVGNVADIPTQQEWETVTRWGKIYGDLVHLEALGTHIIYVNSSKVAHDLFEKRSSLYSDRPVLPMLNDLMGAEWIMTFIPYGGRWRRHRRTFNQKFHQAAVSTHQGVQIKQTRAFLKRLRETPQEFMQHVRHLSGAIIIEIIYGFEVLEKDDPHIQTADEVAASLAETATPGAFLVDTFPILKHVPVWMPGAGFRRKALEWSVPMKKMTVAPYKVVKQQMAAGTAKPSFLASSLEDLAARPDAPPDEEIVIRDTAGVAYLGGADTTVSAMNSFFLAMALYPEVQRKAQNEIDGLIGDGLPDFEHREDLPYINALCKEILRWHPVVPLGVAHKNTQDDVYGDFFIPAGSVIVGNAWGMLRDEADFGPETEKFKPERFLQPGVKDPDFAFGFGRRACPGRYMAINSIFIAAASILKMFDITPPKDNEGNDIPQKDAYTSGFLSHPEPFQCLITPRPGAEILLAGITD